MKNLYLTVLALIVAWPLHSQVAVSQIDAPLVETFDGMGATGTAFLGSWTAIRSGGSGVLGATLAMVASDGSASSGNVYNLGTASNSDRAFGSLASISTVPRFGTSFINNTTSVITSIDFSGIMEQWRSGSINSQPETSAFEYSFDATSLNTGTWTALSGMDLVEKLTATTSASAVNGNLVDNQTVIAATASGLGWAPSSTLWVRWTDTDNTGSDGIYAINDFQLIPHTSVQTGSLTLTNPVADQTYQSGQAVTFKWTAVDVAKIKFQMQTQGSTVWTDVEDLNNIDATTGQLDFTIPLDAQGGQMQMRIVDQNNAAVISAPSGFFTLVDVHFAGLSTSELWPVNNQENVPTDLIYGYLKLVFNEDVAWGQGNIYLRKGSDNSIVRTFNATSGNSGYAADSKRVLLLQIEHELFANKQYYVAIDADAIVDLATVPNAYSGFAANTVWSFTTGATNSIVPIETIQTPVDATDASPKVNQKVKAKGTVMYRNSNGYFIQEGTGPFMGIYVCHAGNTVEAGDVVEVYGTIKEYSSFTEFDSVEFARVISKGSSLFNAIDISAGFSEQYESMLVRLSGVKVSSNGFVTANEFTVSDAAESTTWAIDDLIYTLGTAPTLGTEYESITGFLYGYGGFKLAPCKAGDLVQVPTAIDETESSTTTVSYQNGTIVVESATAVESVSVISLSGITTETSMSISSETEGEKGKEIVIPVRKSASLADSTETNMSVSSETEGDKGKEIVIPVRKSASLSDDFQSVSLGGQNNATARIKLQRKLSPGIYVVKVVFVNKSVLAGKILVR
jgi:hypothetical protein